MAHNYTFDPFINRAKEMLHQMSSESLRMPGNNNFGYCYTPPPPTSHTDFFSSQLNSWQKSNQSLHQLYGIVQIEQQQVLNTIFKFEPDHFKMLVDVRGYSPPELKVVINVQSIEITASREQTVKEQGGGGYANRTVIRTYELPSGIMQDQVVGNLSNDGTLFIAAPWIQKAY